MTQEEKKTQEAGWRAGLSDLATEINQVAAVGAWVEAWSQVLVTAQRHLDMPQPIRVAAIAAAARRNEEQLDRALNAQGADVDLEEERGG